MMGVPDVALIGSWYIVYIAMFAVVAFALAVVSTQTMFPKSNGVLLFLFYFLFGLASVAVCYCIR